MGVPLDRSRQRRQRSRTRTPPRRRNRSKSPRERRNKSRSRERRRSRSSDRRRRSRDRRNRSRSRDRSYRRRRRTRTPPVSIAMEKINREEKDANDDQNNSTENRSLNVENGNNMGKDLQENGEKKYGLILPVSKKHLEARQSDDYSRTVFAEGNDDSYRPYFISLFIDTERPLHLQEGEITQEK